MKKDSKQTFTTLIVGFVVTGFLAWFLFFGPAASIGADRGFRLYASQTPGDYTFGAEHAVSTRSWPTNTFEITYTVPSAGTWYFVLTAYRGAVESSASVEVNDTFDENEEVTLAWRKYFAYQMNGCSTPRTLGISLTSTTPRTLNPAATGTRGISETSK